MGQMAFVRSCENLVLIFVLALALSGCCLPCAQDFRLGTVAQAEGRERWTHSVALGINFHSNSSKGSRLGVVAYETQPSENIAHRRSKVVSERSETIVRTYAVDDRTELLFSFYTLPSCCLFGERKLIGEARVTFFRDTSGVVVPQLWWEHPQARSGIPVMLEIPDGKWEIAIGVN
jgi:hypothetical protein